MRQSARATLFASIFLFAVSTAAKTSEVDQPLTIVARRPAHRLSLQHPALAREVRPAPHRNPWRETQLSSPALHSACIALACPDSIVLGVGF
jgi:hypothetical protein